MDLHFGNLDGSRIGNDLVHVDEREGQGECLANQIGFVGLFLGGVEREGAVGARYGVVDDVEVASLYPALVMVDMLELPSFQSNFCLPSITISFQLMVR